MVTSENHTLHAVCYHLRLLSHQKGFHLRLLSHQKGFHLRLLSHQKQVSLLAQQCSLLCNTRLCLRRQLLRQPRSLQSWAIQHLPHQLLRRHRGLITRNRCRYPRDCLPLLRANTSSQFLSNRPHLFHCCCHLHYHFMLCCIRHCHQCFHLSLDR